MGAGSGLAWAEGGGRAPDAGVRGALSSLRDYWRGRRKALRQLLWGLNAVGSMGTAMVQALRQPLAHHVQKYALLLLSLGDALGEVRGGVRAAPRFVACGRPRLGRPWDLAQDAAELWFGKDRPGCGDVALF